MKTILTTIFEKINYLSYKIIQQMNVFRKKTQKSAWKTLPTRKVAIAYVTIYK